MKVSSFFSGIGGFDFGLELAGMQIVFQCEVNNLNRKVLQKHWPDIPFHDDITTLKAENIPESDVWCAGFPCQDVSLANNGKRKGLKGGRSGLFFDFIELVQQRNPSWIILENVPGLLSSNSGEDFRTIISKMDELGYSVAWRVLDAKYFGTPQRRRRVFIVASYQSKCAFTVLFDNERTAIIAEESRSSEESFTARIGTGDNGTNFYSIQNAAIGRVHTSGPQGKGFRCDGETWTLDSRGRGDAVCSPHDPFRIRKITGISGGMDSCRYISLGNAVNVNVARWIGLGILRTQYNRMHGYSQSFITSNSKR
jgi:DNA (cytosine-5)-methyltransferase 1